MTILSTKLLVIQRRMGAVSEVLLEGMRHRKNNGDVHLGLMSRVKLIELKNDIEAALEACKDDKDFG